jgi:hypothetical protein
MNLVREMNLKVGRDGGNLDDQSPRSTFKRSNIKMSSSISTSFFAEYMSIITALLYHNEPKQPDKRMNVVNPMNPMNPINPINQKTQQTQRDQPDKRNQRNKPNQPDKPNKPGQPGHRTFFVL